MSYILGRCPVALRDPLLCLQSSYPGRRQYLGLKTIPDSSHGTNDRYSIQLKERPLCFSFWLSRIPRCPEDTKRQDYWRAAAGRATEHYHSSCSQCIGPESNWHENSGGERCRPLVNQKRHGANDRFNRKSFKDNPFMRRKDTSCSWELSGQGACAFSKNMPFNRLLLDRIAEIEWLCNIISHAKCFESH